MAIETHAPLAVVKRIEKTITTKLTLTQQGNIAMQLYIKACFKHGLSMREAINKLRRNMKASGFDSQTVRAELEKCEPGSSEWNDRIEELEQQFSADVVKSVLQEVVNA